VAEKKVNYMSPDGFKFFSIQILPQLILTGAPSQLESEYPFPFPRPQCLQSLGLGVPILRKYRILKFNSWQLYNDVTVMTDAYSPLMIKTFCYSITYILVCISITTQCIKKDLLYQMNEQNIS